MNAGPAVTAAKPPLPMRREDFVAGMLRTVRHPVTLLSTIAAGALLALLGPFGTYDRIEMPLRLVYWVLLCLFNGALAVGCLVVAARFIGDLESWQDLTVLVLVASLANAVPGGIVAAVANDVFLPGDPWQAAALVALGLRVALLTAVLSSAVITVAMLRPRPEPPSDAFDRRIPEPLAGELLALSSEDHYLRVHTTAGQGLILCSLATALEELSPSRGRRVHRSHWVAASAVRSVHRRDGQWRLELRSGEEIPVSRAHVAALKAAGWLRTRG